MERISTGSGDILPKEIQVLRIFGTTKSSSLGGFFQLQLGDDTTGDIHVRAPAMRSKRTRHPDNSMQAAIESLPGVTAPVVVKENDPSAYERYWFISFTQLGNVPQLTISTKSTCDMTASQTETTFISLHILILTTLTHSSFTLFHKSNNLKFSLHQFDVYNTIYRQRQNKYSTSKYFETRENIENVNTILILFVQT